MPLNIKSMEVEKLVTDVSFLTFETKTEAIRQALVERLTRLHLHGKRAAGGGQSLRSYLERNVWPTIPASELGRVLTREEGDNILGYGPEGY